MNNKQILKSIERYAAAADLPLQIAIGKNAQAKNWETISINWGQLVSAFSIPIRTKESFAEYKRSAKAAQAKAKDVGGFLGGSLTGPRRLKSAVACRSLITLDFDGPNGKGMSISLGELLDLYKEKYNNEAALYTTHSHESGAPRVRLILPLSRSLAPDEYEPVARMIAQELGIDQVDPASFVVSQFMYWSSAAKDGEYRFIHIPGEPMDPEAVLECYEDFRDKREWPSARREVKQKNEPAKPLEWNATLPAEHSNDTGPIDHDKAVDACRSWAERERDNLNDYQNFVSALLVIAKAVQLNEIQPEAGRECAALLAGDRTDWQEQNIEKFEKELANPDIMTDYSFRKKFMYGSENSNAAIEPVETICRRWDTATSLYRADLPPIEFYIDQILPVGVGWLAGAPKVGKSFLAIQMAQAISCGVQFLGYKTVKTPVIYYSLEMAENLMQSRLRLMFTAEDLSHDMHIAYSMPGLSNGGFQVLEDDIKQLNAGAVFIDVHGLISTDKSTQKAMYEQTYKEMAAFRSIAERNNCSIVLITHLNKNSVGDDFDRIMGSTANRGATDFNIILAKRENRNPLIKEVMFKEESRKSEGVDLVLEQEKGIFTNLGTVQNILGMRKHEDYLTDPVANAIKCTVSHQDHAKVTAAELLDIMPEWARDEYNPQSIGTHIKKITNLLQVNDSIVIEKGRDKNTRFYEVRRQDPRMEMTPILSGFRMPNVICGDGDKLGCHQMTEELY